MPKTDAEFRSHLVEELRTARSGFRFSEFVEQAGVSRELADAVAEKLVVQLFRKSVSDGVITDAELEKLDRLVDLLELSQERRKQALGRPAQGAFRHAVNRAKEDGVVTDQEREQLQKLRAGLELATATAHRSESMPRKETESSEHSQQESNSPDNSTSPDTYGLSQQSPSTEEPAGHIHGRKSSGLKWRRQTTPEVLPVRLPSELAPRETEIQTEGTFASQRFDFGAMGVVLAANLLLLLSGWVIGIVFGIGQAFLGYFALRAQRAIRSRQQIMESGRRTPIASLVRGQRVNAKGRVVAFRQLLTSPLHCRPCVYHRSRINDVVPTKSEDGPSEAAVPVFEDDQAVECVIDDGTGQAVVDLRYAEVLLHRRNTDQPLAEDPMPQRGDAVSRNYQESLLEEGDTVVVIGKRAMDDTDDLPRVTRGRDFIVSQSGARGAQSDLQLTESWVAGWCVSVAILTIISWIAR